MQRYIIIAIAASFSSGILELTPDQASSRAHALTPLGDGLYEVTQPVQFKNGEVVGFDGDTNKALLQLVEPIEANLGKSSISGKTSAKNKKR